MRAAVSLSFILILAPFLAGRVTAGQKSGVGRKYLFGFITLVGGFFICYAADIALSEAVVLGGSRAYSMSWLCAAFMVFSAIVFVAGAGLLVRDSRAAVRRERGSGVTASADGAARGGVWGYLRGLTPIWWAALGLIIFQILRLVIAQPVEYRDDRTYIALINDYIYTDTLYGSNPDTGEAYSEIAAMPVKWLITPWYHFLAAISGISGLHPTVIYRTILPIAMLILTYLALYELARALGVSGRAGGVYMLVCAVAMEALSGSYDPATGALVWPLWGKNPAALIIIPLVCAAYSEVFEKGVGRRLLLLVLLGIAGCGMSATAMMVLPIEFFALFLIFFKKSPAKAAAASLCGVLPALIELVLYVGLTRGWMAL